MKAFLKLFLMSLMLIISCGLYAQDTWDGTVATSFSGGDGTESSPYLINTAEEWAYFCAQSSYTGKYYKLCCDIYFPKGGSYCAVDNFDGVFDGNGHDIKNYCSASYAFNSVSGTIKNFSFTIYYSRSGKYDWGWHGQFINEVTSTGLIQNCYIYQDGICDANVQPKIFKSVCGKVSNCYFTGLAQDDSAGYGVICNNVVGKFINCHSTYKGTPSDWMTNTDKYENCDKTVISTSTWKANIQGTSNFTVTFHDETGYTSTDAMILSSPTTITLPTPTCSCTFAGWYHNDNLIKTTTLYVSDDMDLYAYWTRNIINQPTANNPTFAIEDSEHASFTWYKLASTDKFFPTWDSTNHGSNSSSNYTYTMQAKTGQTLYIDWKVSSEDFDEFSIKIDGVSKLSQGGESYGTYTYTIPSDGTYTVIVSYEKDDEDSSGDDKAQVTRCYLGSDPSIVDNAKAETLSNPETGSKYYCVATYNNTFSNISSPSSYTSDIIEIPIASGTTGDCTWTLDTDYTLTISGTGAMGNYKAGTAPWGTSVKKLVINEGVTRIGGYSLYGCSELASVELPSTLTDILYDAFEGCSGLENVALPEGLQFLGEKTFKDCTSLKTITLPSSLAVSYTMYNVFWGCTSLESINVDSSNSNYSSVDGVLYSDNGTSLTAYPEGKKDATFTIPAAVTSIYSMDAYHPMFHNKNLTAINVDASNTTFASVDGVLYTAGINTLVRYPEGKADETYTLPATVTGATGYNNLFFGYCFWGCNNLKDIEVEDGSTQFTSVDGILYYHNPNSTELMLERVPVGRTEDVHVSDNCVDIMAYAFEDCGSIKKFVVPCSTLYIDVPNFYGCYNLSEIVCLGTNTYYRCEDYTDTFLADTKYQTGTLHVPADALEWYQSADGWKEWANIVAIVPVTSITLDNTSTSLEVGSTTTLTASVLPENADVKDLTWTSSDESVATVDANGNVTAIADGSATITASAVDGSGITATCALTVGSADVEDDTDISQYDNVIYTNNVEMCAGGNVTLLIKMKNNVGMTGYQFNLYAPSGIDLSTATATRTTTRKEDNVSFSKSVQNDGSYKVVCYTSDNETFTGNDGEVCTITFTIPQGYAVGNYPIYITNQRLTAGGFTYNVDDKIKSTLTVKDYILGDANSNSEVEVGDLSAIVGFILNTNIISTFNEQAADANCNNEVEVGDLSTIVKMILGVSSAKGIKSQQNLFDVTVPQMSMRAGEETTLFVQMQNSDMSGFQFDINLPEGLVCTGITPVSSRIDDSHYFGYSTIGENSSRVLCYSTTNSSIVGNSGNIVAVSIKADKDLMPGDYDVTLSNIYNTEEQKISSVSGKISVSDITGISEIINNDPNTAMYDLNGRMINAEKANCKNLHKGVYIINGKKYVNK